MDSEEDFYCSSGNESMADIPEYSDDDGKKLYNITRKPYKILTEERIKQLQENDISQVCSVLAVSRGLACSLLLRNKWSVASASEEWFADQDKTRTAATKQKPTEQDTYCKICMEEVKTNLMSSASCGHLFCTDCWTTYVAVSIHDGPQCLTLRCPEPNCAALAGFDIVEAVAAADDKRKFYNYLHRSYVELSSNRKWCPGPGCDYAVEHDGGEETYITCECRHKFCWRCREELHRPLSCDTVASWARKNTSEEGNNLWILLNTKRCPKCSKRIEKDQGCNLMTCNCGYHFCWLCLNPFKSFNHKCNRFGMDQEKARGNGLESNREALPRYTHYFERYDSNHKSSGIARKDLVRARDEDLPALSKAQDKPETELQFVLEAWEQIVECRRALKWSYVFGYYFKATEKEKRELFECFQEQAESALERLHHCTEFEMRKFLEPSSEGFDDFRLELMNLTRVTNKYFENLMQGLEKDLAEVDSKVE